MIVRTWRGRAKAENADAYQRFVTTKVFAALPSIQGHRGATLLRRRVGDEVEFVAMTTWDSLEAIKAFAGADPFQVKGRRSASRPPTSRAASITSV